MKASGKAQGKVLALLEPYRDQLDPVVFGEPYSPPVSDGSGRDRKLLGRSIKLLKEAGWTQSEDGWINQAGEKLEIELLGNSPLFERVINPWAERLSLIGVPASFPACGSSAVSAAD